MKLRVILSLIVALFIGQSMYAMSNEVLRRPIILDGEIIEEGNRSTIHLFLFLRISMVLPYLLSSQRL